MTQAQILRALRRVERAAYPEEMRMLGGTRTWSDLADYCEGEPAVWLAGDGQAYCVACRDTREIVDLAACRPVSLAELREVAAWLGPGTWTADLRASTSGRLLRAAARLGWIALREMGAWDWDGNEMIAVEIDIAPTAGAA